MKFFAPLCIIGVLAAQQQQQSWWGRLWQTLTWSQPFRSQEELFNETAAAVDGKLRQAALKAGSSFAQDTVESAKQQVKDSVEHVKHSVKDTVGSAKKSIENSMASVQDTVDSVKDSMSSVNTQSANAAHSGLWEPLRHFLDHDAHGEGKLKEALSLVSVSTVRTFPDAYFLVVDVPGIPMSQLHVRIDGTKGRVHIQGSHEACATADPKVKTNEAREKVCVERAIDRFFPLPEDVDSERVTCVWRDGVVMIRLPRIASRGHEVPVKEASTSWLF